MDVTVPLAIQPSDGLMLLIWIPGINTTERQAMWTALRENVDRAAQEHGLWRALTRIFLKPHVGLASIHQIFRTSQSSSSHHHHHHRIILGPFTYNAALTEMYRNPPMAETFGEELWTIPREDPAFVSAYQAMVVRRDLDRKRIALALILLLFLSPPLGLLAGKLSHNAGVGVATSAAVFALASFLQRLAMWLKE